MPLNQPVRSGQGAGRAITYATGSNAELKLASEQSGGAWAPGQWRLLAGDEPPLHTHTREDETVYALNGAITAHVGDQQIEVEAESYAAPWPRRNRHPRKRARDMSEGTVTRHHLPARCICP